MRYLKRLLLISLLVTIGSWIFWYIIFHHDRFSIPKKVNVQALVGEPHNSPQLPTQIIAELCGLSSDTTILAPWELYVARFRAFPGVQSCSSSCINDIGFIQYTLRTPLFSLGGYENIALDIEGIGFPIVPVFSPLTLPVLFPTACTQGAYPRVDPAEVELARTVAGSAQKQLSMSVRQIDLRFWNHLSPYRREIIVLLDGGMYLRLPVSTYENALMQVSHLLKKHESRLEIVDCRFKNCLLIQEISPT